MTLAPGPCERQAAEMRANQAAESKLLASNQQKELEDLPIDYPLSTSEDEGDKDGEKKHQKPQTSQPISPYPFH